MARVPGSWLPPLVSIFLGGVGCQADASNGGEAPDGGREPDAWGGSGDSGPLDMGAEEHLGELVEEAGSTPSVLVAIRPTPQTVSDAGSAQSNRVDAVLMAMASGVRGVEASYSWSQLQELPGEESPVWDELEGLAKVAREHKEALLVSIRTVDGTLDKRPAGLKGTSWSEEGGKTQQAMRALLDTLFSRIGSELRYLSLAHEVDRYIEGHTEEAEDLIQFAARTMQDAKTHSRSPQGLRVGVTWSHQAWLGASPPLVGARGLIEASEDVFVTYAPMAGQNRAGPPDQVYDDLEGLVKAIPDRPIVLWSVSYPSSELIGASEAAQGRFVKELFSVVSERRDRFPAVVVRGLHDDDPGECVERAAAQGFPGSPELYAWWCSTGLRTRDGVAKPSYELFRAAAAVFLEP